MEVAQPRQGATRENRTTGKERERERDGERCANERARRGGHTLAKQFIFLFLLQRRRWGVRWYTVTGKPDRMRRRGYPWDPSILVKEGEHLPAGALTETVDHKKVKEGNLVRFCFLCVIVFCSF